MSLWEYKVITSGKGGFATPALLEKFLNDLGKEEWEIIHFQPQPDNALVFTGLARRSTQRDWTLQDAAAAAAKTEADKLRAEFEAKFKGATGAPAPAGADEKPETIAGEKIASDDGFRRVRDTERDLDPEADDEEPKDEWDMLTSEDELPTFFEAIRPHLRRNQRGPGMSVGVEHLAKKWDLSDADLKGALVECGFAVPDNEDTAPAYLEYEGDLYWLNINRRGELWLNTKEKPRQVFRTVPAQKVASEAAEEVKPEGGTEKPRSRDYQAESSSGEPASGSSDQSPVRPSPPAISSGPLPQGADLLEKIRPLMRRNRRGPGGSGSTTFLSRGLKCGEADLMTAFGALGLILPAAAADDPVMIEIGPEVWWLNQDQRGGVWINGREKSEGTSAPMGNDSAPKTETAKTEAPSALAPAPGHVLAGVRLLLKETKTGAVAGKVDRLADDLGKAPADFLATLTGAGLVVPEKAKDKPVFIEHAGEIFWLNKNAKDELWLNAKASKFAGDDDGKKPARSSRPKKKAD
jgi:hypothetical protein